MSLSQSVDPTTHPTVRLVDFERRPASDFRHVTAPYIHITIILYLFFYLIPW